MHLVRKRLFQGIFLAILFSIAGPKAFANCPDYRQEGPFQIKGPFDCAWLDLLHKDIERYREIYPSVEREGEIGNDGVRYRFEFSTPRFANLARLEMLNETWIWRSGARALQLEVNWKESGFWGTKKNKTWTHYFPYHPFGIEAQRSASELQPLIRELIRSFFVERDASIRNEAIEENGTQRISDVNELRSVTDRVALFFPAAKFNSFGPVGDTFLGKHDFAPTLISELEEALLARRLPDEVQSFTLHVFVTCLRGFPGSLVMRDMGMRRFPSTTGGCVPFLDQKVVAFFGEAYDHQGRRLIYGLPTHALAGNIDTLPFPYTSGQVRAVVSRFLVSIRDALAEGPVHVSNGPLLPFEFGPDPYARHNEVVHNLSSERFQEVLEDARKQGIRDE